MPPYTQRPPTVQPQLPVNRGSVSFGKITSSGGHRIVLYGTGGIGKTTLAAHAPGPVAFIDLDESLGKLRTSLDAFGITSNILPVDGVTTWDSLRSILQADGWDSVKTIVIDTLTKAEELCVAYTLANVPHEKGHKCNRLEDYGFGKGQQHVFDSFLPLLADLDVHCRAGRNVIICSHECVANVPNPNGDDWIRYEPRLQNPNSGKASIRLRVKEWSDHMLFMGYDVSVNKDGKGQGSGTRTIYPAEMPHCMAKSRTIQTPIFVDAPGVDIWNQIIK